MMINAKKKNKTSFRIRKWQNSKAGEREGGLREPVRLKREFIVGEESASCRLIS